MGQNYKNPGTDETIYNFFTQPHPYQTGGGGFRGQHLKVTKRNVLKSTSEWNYPERLHCKYPG